MESIESRWTDPTLLRLGSAAALLLLEVLSFGLRRRLPVNGFTGLFGHGGGMAC
jgi:hypothetical protein